jgi:hypothetical protein
MRSTKKSKYFKKMIKTRGHLLFPFKTHMKVNKKSNSNKLSKSRRGKSKCSFNESKYSDKKSARLYLSSEIESL